MRNDRPCRIFSVVGARPQFVKLSAIANAITCLADRQAKHKIIHTGQHYDPAMSAVFFEELDISPPDYNLEVGSGSHATQTGEIMIRLEPVLTAERPDWVVVYGDTNTTLAGSVVASKLGIPTAHIEAGLRSHNRRMPEELNRIATDHLSDLLFCPTAIAMQHLAKENLCHRAVLTGDVMYDAALRGSMVAETRGGPLADRWQPKEFALATVHRAENTDDPERLGRILHALDRIARTACPVVLPVHPRTRNAIAALGWSFKTVTVIPAVSYLEMLMLEKRARFILTDSGGVQKEAYFMRVPCITLRDETEWEETLANGCNTLVGTDEEKILTAAECRQSVGPWDAVYGDGNAAGAILNILIGAHSTTAS